MWMRSFRASSFLLLLLILSACVVNENPIPDPVPDPPQLNYREAGDFNRTLSHNGIERTYLLHVPEESDAEKTIPLIVVLHGATGDAQSMVDWGALKFNEKADQQNFAVVYPNGTGDVANRSLYWNAVHCCAVSDF